VSVSGTVSDGTYNILYCRREMAGDWFVNSFNGSNCELASSSRSGGASRGRTRIDPGGVSMKTEYFVNSLDGANCTFASGFKSAMEVAGGRIIIPLIPYEDSHMSEIGCLFGAKLI
jgi:hypothetical protein